MRVLAARALADLVGQRLRHGLRDERLAAPWRPIEEHALRRLQSVLLEQLRVQEGQLDRVADRLDPTLQAPDVLVRDVRIPRHELLDLLLRELLERDAQARVDEQRIAGTDHVLVAQGAGQRRDDLLVAAADDDDAMPSQAIGRPA